MNITKPKLTVEQKERVIELVRQCLEKDGELWIQEQLGIERDGNDERKWPRWKYNGAHAILIAVSPSIPNRFLIDKFMKEIVGGD